jgi:NAD(P)-dependent dehydrogenase (short-subunit alcohol dehydrogenase family)
LQISLQGKVAWITGASGGIGSAVARTLLDAGATVVSTDIAEEPAFRAERLVHRRCDVTKQADIEAVTAFCDRELGGVDVLFNNAGIIFRMDVLDITPELWDKLMAINLKAYFFCAQAAARSMRAKGRGGSIVNTISVVSDAVNPNTIPYCTSKGGVKTLTLALAAALGQYGIRVNGISPGALYTNLNKDHWDAGNAAPVEARTPLGRLGVPEDLGPAVAFLASDQASFITGAVLPVHGGWTTLA